MKRLLACVFCGISLGLSSCAYHSPAAKVSAVVNVSIMPATTPAL